MATAAILQPGDVPASLSICLGSGPIDVYVAALAQADASLAMHVSQDWEQLRALGAQDAAISIYAAVPSTCHAELGATANVKAAAAFVARFEDAGEADRAWESGVFGFVPPPPGELVAGVTRGPSTGLGLSSFTYVRSPVRLACWHRSVFVALVVISNLDPTAFMSATAAVDARLN